MIVHQPELTVNEVKQAYTYYLEEKLGKIFSMSKNKAVSLNVMQGIVKSYIAKARYSYPTKHGKKLTKKQWFLDQVDSAESKKSLYFLCLNSVNKARQTEAR